jgi:hypothetical protein
MADGMAGLSSYHNTNRESGEALQASRRQAGRQQDAVLAFFQAHPDTPFAPHEIQVLVLPGAPLTSIRRAITNLTTSGLLEKTDQMRTGTYDKDVHTWRLRRGEDPLRAMLRQQLANHIARQAQSSIG